MSEGQAPVGKRPDLVLGVDPGLYGGFALVRVEHEGDRLVFRLYDNWPMPTRVMKTKPWGFDREIDLLNLQGRLGKMVQDHGRLVMAVERQLWLPGQGVRSTFRTGFNMGMLVGLLGCYASHMVPFTPAGWKKLLGLGKSKRQSIERASYVFGVRADILTDGEAEAGLIAYAALGRIHHVF